MVGRIPYVLAVVGARFLYLPARMMLLMYQSGTATHVEVYLIPTYPRLARVQDHQLLIIGASMD